MVTSIRKRDGRLVPFDADKIAAAINKAFHATGAVERPQESRRLARLVVEELEGEGLAAPDVEHVQDVVERTLMRSGFEKTARAYVLYRAERSRVREMGSRLMKTMEDLSFKAASDSDIKRENANIDADTAMGTMLKYGSESAKQFYDMFILKPQHARAHREGDIHIHDLDFYTLTTTCCQIDILKLFKGGFSTGHGVLREPQDITSYAALCCIAIQSNQNDQHGQSVVNFDYGMAPGVAKTYIRTYKNNLARAFELLAGMEDAAERVAPIIAALGEKGLRPCLAEGEAEALAGISNDGDIVAEGKAYAAAEAEALAGISNDGDIVAEDKAYAAAEAEALAGICSDGDIVAKAQAYARKQARRETDRSTFQAMEAFIHNLNTMHSRAGAQTPFSSINYGMDTSPEGRMVMRNLMLATEAGLGGGETPIFPIQIFRVKEGVNYNPGEPNYDLFQLACRVSAKRLFPNFSFLDAPFNAQYYKGTPETEIAYMGCRTRVIGNVVDREREICNGRGNLSFTSINLPRIAIRANGDVPFFFQELDRMIDLVVEQLLERFAIQAKKRVRNYPFLMGQGVWMDSEKLGWDDEIGEVLRHGSLTVGFIGLAESLKALKGAHHGENEASQNLGLEIVGHMRSRMEEESAKHNMNFTLIATPAEGLSGRFVRIDKERFGEIAGVTDRDYYTNSFHIPVYHPLPALEKVRLEAPYHALTNAGHITYIEMDGNPSNNLEAFEKVVRAMKEAGVGYGSINHPVDRDPACGYTGIIGDECPRCGRNEAEGAPFERIRRITGYLVGTLDRFNNAKRAEEGQRVKHRI